MMKKLLASLLVTAMGVTMLVGCGSKEITSANGAGGEDTKPIGLK